MSLEAKAISTHGTKIKISAAGSGTKTIGEDDGIKCVVKVSNMGVEVNDIEVDWVDSEFKGHVPGVKNLDAFDMELSINDKDASLYDELQNTVYSTQVTSDEFLRDITIIYPDSQGHGKLYKSCWIKKLSEPVVSNGDVLGFTVTFQPNSIENFKKTTV